MTGSRVLHHEAVAITGMGLLSPIGLTPAQAWVAILEGRTGLGPLPAIESPLPPDSTGGQAVDPPTEYHAEMPREARGLRWAIESALRDARASSGETPSPSRRRVMLGTTLHGMRAGGRFFRADDPFQLRPFLANATAALAIEGLGLQGGVATTCSACSSSLGAITLGIGLLQAGEADLVVAGGYDPISEYAWAGFNSLRLVAPGWLKPFCRGRQGMKVAESYAIVVLERLSDARQRGVQAKAIIAGWGESADAHHLTQPHPQGEGAARAMRQAVGRAGIEASSLGLVAAHATGTPDNDAAEHQALQTLLGPALPSVPVVGFKSYLGHTLGGAGAAELILSAMALNAGVVPACANVRADEVEFEGLRVATGEASRADLRYTLNSSMGFGGANTCVVLARPAISNADKRDMPNALASQSPREVWITGMGLVAPGMLGLEALRQALQTAIAPPWQAPRGSLNDTTLSELINIRRARRLSDYVKFTLAPLVLAMRDARIIDHREAIERATTMLATTHGSTGLCCEYYSQIVREGVLAANPVLFAEGVPNAAAAHVSTTLGIRGPCQTIIGSRTAGLDALTLAAMRIATGAADLAFVSAAEEHHAVMDRAYRALGVQRAAGLPARREDRSGFFSSPGGAALVLESADHARDRGARPWGRVETSACEFRPPPQSPRAVNAVLERLGAASRIITSCNGTWIDRAEAIGIRRESPETTMLFPYDLCGELFSALPILGIIQTIVDAPPSVKPSAPDSFNVIATDWSGSVSGARIQPFAHPQL